MIAPRTVFAFFTLVSLIGCKLNSTDTGNNFKVDSTIRSTAQQHIRIDGVSNAPFSFRTKALARFYTNDSLNRLSVDTSNLRIWARYSWHSDTLVLMGYAPDLLSGFTAKIRQGSLVGFQHSRCGRSTDLFRRNEKAGFSRCIEVPCDRVELMISSLPDSTKHSGMFGYVNFRTERYHLRSNSQVAETRAEMKFYFIAYNYNLYLRKLGVDTKPNHF